MKINYFIQAKENQTPNLLLLQLTISTSDQDL